MSRLKTSATVAACVALAAVAALVLSAPMASAGLAGDRDDNPEASQAPDSVGRCLSTWAHLYRSDGSTFESAGACVSYAVTGGTLAELRITFTHPPDDPSFDATYFRAEGGGRGLLPGSTVVMWAEFAAATASPWLGELAGQVLRVNGGTVGADGSTITPETAAPTFFGNYLRCSGPIAPFPGPLWDRIWVTGTSEGGASISSPAYGYTSEPTLPC